MKIILGSGSPRRRELLGQIGLDFTVRVSNAPEVVKSTLPEQVVQELSMQKAEAVLADVRAELAPGEEYLVIGADTVVAALGKILGKPADDEGAKEMLRLLQGKNHEVYTGVSLIKVDADGTCSLRTSFSECTRVVFYPMSEEEISTYVATKDPLDKAGSYGIQGICARYIAGIEGDYNNVVGLPVGRLYQEMKKYKLL